MRQPTIIASPETGPAWVIRRERSVVHAGALALVWITIAAGAFVFTEPAPVDALAIGLVVLLPVIGLVAVAPMLVLYLALWLISAANAFYASSGAPDIPLSVTHNSVSLYLYVWSFVMAAFVAVRPLEHSRLIYKGYVLAALLAAGAGIVGYFDLFPGAGELLTRYGRASSTFKDPNVYGPFLVPAWLYLLDAALNRSFLKALAPLAGVAFLTLGILVSFSRGAWMVTAASAAIYAAFVFATATSNRQRLRIILFLASSVAVVLSLIVVATHVEQVSRLMEERATLDQSYDEGPEGRFGGQMKAIDLIVEYPMGLGSRVFSETYHPEEAHNVYLSMLMNAGWVGGSIYIIMVVLTIVLGFRHARQDTPWRRIFLISYAPFVAIALEGFIIDTDHWRYFYLLMALVWGAISASAANVAARSREDERRRAAREVTAAHAATTIARRPARYLVPSHAPARLPALRRASSSSVQR